MNGLENFDYQGEIERLRKHFGYDFVGVALVQPDVQNFEMRWKYVAGNRSDRFKRIILKSGKGVVGHVVKTGRPFFVEDAEDTIGKLNLFNYPLVIAEGLLSFGAIPLYKKDRVKGVLLVGYRVNKLTYESFMEFQRHVGSKFGPFTNKEMVVIDGDK